MAEVYENTIILVILVMRLKEARIARFLLAFSSFTSQPKNQIKVYIEILKQNSANALA